MGSHGVVEWSDRVTPMTTGDPLAESVPPPRPRPNIAEDLPFRVWAEGDRLRLVGCVDTFTAERLASMLAAAPVAGPTVVLDLTGLRFADAAATRAVARWAQALRAAEIVVHLSGAPSFFGRVWHLLAFDQAGSAVFGEPAV